MKYVPNALTITRILVTPVLLFLLFSESLSGRLWALGLFILASISDYLDGRLARQFMVRSSFGQFLDPIADKVLVLGTFAALAWIIPSLVPWWAVALIAARDLAVTWLKARHRSQGKHLKTLAVAKLKTTVQLTFLIAVLAVMAAQHVPGPLGRAGSWVMNSSIIYWLSLFVAAITVYTGIVYFTRKEIESQSLDDGQPAH